AGTRRLSTRLHRCQPGIARSRENAYQERDALVRAGIPQKSWPMLEIRITSSAQPELIALVKTEIAVPPASLIAFVSEAANVIASRTNQTNSAAEKTDCQSPRAPLICASWVSSATCADAS